MKKRILIASAAVLAIAAVAVALTFNTVTLVAGALVETGDMESTQTVEGAYIERDRNSLRSDRAGVLSSVQLQEGQQVNSGESIAVYSDAVIQNEIAAVEEAMAKLDDSEAAAVSAANQTADEAALALEAATANANGVKSLAQSIGVEYMVFNRAIRDYMLANANAAVSVEVISAMTEPDQQEDTESERQKMENWLEQLEAQLDGLHLTASATGTVLNVVAEPGDSLEEGDLVAVVGNKYGGLVVAEMDASLGTEVKLITGGKTYQGEVVDSAGKVVYIEPEAGFAAGDDIAVSRTIEALEDVCIVPSACVATDEEGSYVMIFNDGVLQRRSVTVGMEQGDSVAVTAGLGVGETAVLFPERYQDGMRAQLEEE